MLDYRKKIMEKASVNASTSGTTSRMTKKRMSASEQYVYFGTILSSTCTAEMKQNINAERPLGFKFGSYFIFCLFSLTDLIKS